MNTITAREFKQKLESGDTPELIDVRTPAEFSEVHVRGARNVPLERIDASKIAAEGDRDVYVICQKGSRGSMAARKLAEAGFHRAINVEGGTEACVSEGVAVNRGQKVMSLERQVRIAAGSLVLVGAALSLVHPWFVGICAFVGAGLVFAGITDTCGMGMMLARMPWNQVGSSCSGGNCATGGKTAPTA
jgi:rhodanese-related sulfurtransferase